MSVASGGPVGRLVEGLVEGLAGVGVVRAVLGAALGDELAVASGDELAVALGDAAATVGAPAVRVSVLGVDAAPLHPASTAAPASASADVSLRAVRADDVRPVGMAPVWSTSPKSVPDARRLRNIS
jgi:hypothetical protein